MFGDERRNPGITLEPGAALLVHHQQLRVGELECLAHLRAGPPPVHGHQDRVEAGDGPEREDPLAAVGRAHGDAVTGSDVVPLLQPARQRPDEGDQLVEVDAGAVAEHIAVAVAEPVRTEEHVTHGVRPVAEDPEALAEHLLVDDLERHPGGGEASRGREQRVEAGIGRKVGRHGPGSTPPAPVSAARASTRRTPGRR